MDSENVDWEQLLAILIFFGVLLFYIVLGFAFFHLIIKWW